MKFRREHDSDLDDRSVHNIFETLNTFVRTRDLLTAGKILAELDYAEKPPKPYTKQELKAMFAAMGTSFGCAGIGLFQHLGVHVQLGIEGGPLLVVCLDAVQVLLHQAAASQLAALQAS